MDAVEVRWMGRPSEAGGLPRRIPQQPPVPTTPIPSGSMPTPSGRDALQAGARADASAGASTGYAVAPPAGGGGGLRRGRPLSQRERSLHETIDRLHGERLRLLRQRRLHLALLGFALSIPFHLILIMWFASTYLSGPRGYGGGAGPVTTIELGIIEGEALLDEGPTAEEFAIADGLGTTDTAAGAVSLEAGAPAIGLESGGSGSLDAQGGGPVGVGGPSGSGSGGLGPGGGGGGGGASFFGLGGRGSRFVYIVDISGSMANGARFQVAMDELRRSITALPDFASFAVYLFSDAAYAPPFQETYLKAMPSNIARMKKWLDTTSPMGGTEPGDAFQRSLALSPLPDVIFFLTDGEIPEHVPDFLSQRNGASGKKRVTIHCIAFSNDAGQDSLRRIARDSEGTFRFVPVGGP
jgi:hypothetical protein